MQNKQTEKKEKKNWKIKRNNEKSGCILYSFKIFLDILVSFISMFAHSTRLKKKKQKKKKFETIINDWLMDMNMLNETKYKMNVR